MYLTDVRCVILHTVSQSSNWLLSSFVTLVSLQEITTEFFGFFTAWWEFWQDVVNSKQFRDQEVDHNYCEGTFVSLVSLIFYESVDENVWAKNKKEIRRK